MPAVELEIRRMQSGEVMVAQFPDAGAAAAWLCERPRFVEVLRLCTWLHPELEGRLRAVMRPLDDEERARRIVLEGEAEARRALRQREAYAAASEADNDPDRLMVIRWQRTRGLSLEDELDTRAIPDRVRQVVLEWIAERDAWVFERGEQVAAACLCVWPGPVPSGIESERIEPGGQFVTGRRDRQES